MKLSFKEALERPAATLTDSRDRSASPTASVILFAPGNIDRPVDYIRLLRDHGLSMRKARAILDRLPSKQPVAVNLRAHAIDQFIRESEKLGVLAGRLANPEVDPKTIRDKQGLSQPEFACLYGLEVNTLKNWEQDRYKLDGPARLLLSVIEKCPHAVIMARTKMLDPSFVTRLKISTSRVCETYEGGFDAWDWEDEWCRGYRVTYEPGAIRLREHK
jgi:DNA-binding transcriptional regulator YiaG